MIKSVDFMSKAAAEKLIYTDHAALISISEPGENVYLSGKWDDILVLKFHDTDADANNGQNWSALGKPKYWVKFDESQAKEIIDFMNRIHVAEKRKDLIIHCHAGISRSAAVAKYVATQIVGVKFNHGYSLYNRHVFRTLMTVQGQIGYDEPYEYT